MRSKDGGGRALSKKSESQVLLYRAPDGRTRLEVRMQDETVWLTQAQMAELFQTTVANVNIHLRNIFTEGEMDKVSAIKEYLITAADGKGYQTKHYNLDAILAVGYRVKSHRGTQFRIWATQRLREYIVKGFTLDDERRLILDDVTISMGLTEKQMKALEKAKRPELSMTLADWEDFQGYVASASNHARDGSKLQRRADALSDRIQLLLRTHTEADAKS